MEGRLKRAQRSGLFVDLVVNEVLGHFEHFVNGIWLLRLHNKIRHNRQSCILRKNKFVLSYAYFLALPISIDITLDVGPGHFHYFYIALNIIILCKQIEQLKTFMERCLFIWDINIVFVLLDDSLNFSKLFSIQFKLHFNFPIRKCPFLKSFSCLLQLF